MLLRKGALLSLNKKKCTALQEAYDTKKTKISREITRYIIQKNLVKNIIQIKNSNKIDIEDEQQLKLLINDFIKYLRKNYLDRNIFIRFSAKNNERSRALIIAARRCNSIIEFKDLFNNQLNLLKNAPKRFLPKDLIADRWSEIIKNRPANVNKSQFYRVLHIFVTENFGNNNISNESVKNGNIRSALYR